jgi:hypothetical protein
MLQVQFTEPCTKVVIQSLLRTEGSEVNEHIEYSEGKLTNMV